MKDGKENVEIRVLKKRIYFFFQFFVIPKGIISLQKLQNQLIVHVVIEAIAEYLHQVMVGAKVDGQIPWWEVRGSVGKEEACCCWLSKAVRDANL